MKKGILFLFAFSSVFTSAFAVDALRYSENNQGYASFDISMPIDATGYTLQGKNLKGGNLTFSNRGNYVAPFLAHETGDFELPTSVSAKGKPFIKTNIHYNAIKFIDPIGVYNLFIKIGTATRTEIVSGLDPFVLKDGSYTWSAPIFSFGTETNDVNDKSENRQFMEVASGAGDPSNHNGMYTLQFYLFTQGNGDTAIAEHPQKTARLEAVLKGAYATDYTCHADGVWGSGGSDPYRTLTGACHGSTMTFPAGPNLDYEYCSFQY